MFIDGVEPQDNNYDDNDDYNDENTCSYEIVFERQNDLYSSLWLCTFRGSVAEICPNRKQEH